MIMGLFWSFNKTNFFMLFSLIALYLYLPLSSRNSLRAPDETNTSLCLILSSDELNSLVYLVPSNWICGIFPFSPSSCIKNFS